MLDLSIVVPVYNEEENIPLLYKRIEEVFQKTSYRYELIFVDDGSKDQTLRILKEIKAQQKSAYSSIKIIQLARNFGQHAALAAGFDHAAGNIVVTLDADLQMDPGHILDLIAKLKEGYDFVGGVRRHRKDSFLTRRLPSHVMNLLIGMVVGKRLKDYGCPLNAMKLEIAKEMQQYGEMRKFFKPLAIKLAQGVAEVDIPHNPRLAGHSKYRFINLVDMLFDFIVNFSKQLFQRITIVGLVLVGLNTMVAGVYVGLRILDFIQVMERLQWVVFVGSIFGVQLVVLGILGEFIVRMYRKIAKGPIYEIRHIW